MFATQLVTMEDFETFERLQNIVAALEKDIKVLKRALVKFQKEQQAEKEKDEFLNIQEASEFLNLAVATIYVKVSRGEIPVIKQGKRLYFSKKELIKYIRAGRKLVITEIEDDEDYFNYLNNKKGLKP